MGKMARSELHTTERVVEILRIFLVAQTVQCCLSYMCVAESHNQAFIQTDKHLTYIDGDLNSGIPLELSPGNSFFSDITIKDEIYYSSGIRLDPPMLDFDEQPVGMPRMEKVIVQNNDPKNSLHLLSISGSTVHFHCSFFQDKTVPPGGNTTFDVVFLARQVGNVENTLYIHTSVGSLKYQVFGVGIQNPYRLRPYIGARIPINSSFTPVIQMHNPHSSTIQVLEMFSSEGDLHLELPSGDKEATQELWEIKPYETKKVMRANFVGRVESNHTAFIRIKTDHERNSHLLVLPIEVEFSAEPGIYSPVELLDFGILRTLDEPKTLRLSLINTGTKATHITSISVSPPNDAISIDFRPLKLQPDGNRQYTVAHITFKAAKALHPKQWSGKIVVKTKNNQYKLIVPYQVNVLHGSLVYNANTTNFFSAKAVKNFTRPLTFTNTFNFSVVIYNISLPPDAAQYFSICVDHKRSSHFEQVLNFSNPVTLGPQQTMTPLLLLFHPNDKQLHFSTTMTLHTNASTFLIPIIVYNGLLKVVHHRPERAQGQLDFGTMGVGEIRSMIFTVRNDNPVDLQMARFETNMSWATVELLGVEKGNGTTLTRSHNISDIDLDPLIIKPYHYAVFSITIHAPQQEGAYAAEVWMFTQYEDLFIPIIFRTAEGSLYAIPEKFIFEKVFPGKIPYKVLQINSTFHGYMEVTQVIFQPQDSRFYFQPHNPHTVLLKPQEASIVGKLFFDSKRECKDDCYVGLPTYTPVGHQWLLGLNLDKDVADTDQYLYTRLQQKWHKLERTGQNTANVTIELDTNQVRGFLFSAQAHLHWPSLIKKSRIKFPLTQIGNTTVSDFIVENTADMPVLIQVLPLSLYPNPHTVIDLMSHGLSTDLPDNIFETEDLDIFRLHDIENNIPGITNPVLDNVKNVENTLGVSPHKQSIAAILQPGNKLKVKVWFQPRDTLVRSSLMLIRNNLTIMDTVVLTGQGCQGEMKFSNRKPGSQSPLTFEITEKHLKSCDISDKKSNKIIGPHFTVKRTFTLRNTGELSFYIRGFSINESPCEGYGFKVLDCDGFEMLPNSSKKVDIAFTPDFTMSRIRRMLTILTSLGLAANYTLQATVPPHLLSLCSAALPRPHWEPVLYYSIICVMSFLLICICVAAYFEGDRIIMADIIRRKLKGNNNLQTFDKGKVFDLRNVAGLHLSSPSRSPANVNSSSVTTSPMVGQDLRAAAAKSMIHVNGHVEFHPPTNGRQPFLGSILSILKKFTPRKLLYSSSKILSAQKPQQKVDANNSSGSTNNIDSNDTQRKVSDTPNLQSNIHQACISDQKTTQPVLQNMETDINIDIVNQLTKSTKRTKPGKRHLVDGINIIQGEEDQDSKVNKDIKFSSDSKKFADIDDDQKDKSTLETGDDYIEEEANIRTDVSQTSKQSGKIRGKKIKGKSRSERDSLKEKIPRHDNLNIDDKDETSSTTTDSSTGDQEDKNSNARDSTPEPVVHINFIGSKKSKKSRPDKVVAAVMNGNVVDDDNNFEVTSKSKAHRKIRINPKTVFGGDIMRPSTLDLPYTLPKEKDRSEPAIAAEPSRRIKKSRAPPKSDFLLRTVDMDECNHESGRDSPIPDWDQPSLCSSFPDDLSELSIQTETFAQQHFRNGSNSASFAGTNSYAGPPGVNLSPDHLSASSRSSSYSSIVSANSFGSCGSPVSMPADPINASMAPRIAGQNRSLTLMDGGRNKSFPSFVDSGLMSGKPGVVNSLASSGISSSNWSNMVNSPPVSTMGPSFGLHTIEETSPLFGMHTGNMDGFLKPDYFGSGGDLVYQQQYLDGSGTFPQQQQLTMMQQLQAERRQRFQQHLLRIKKQDWPGFDVPAIHNDSLWDNDYNPLDPLKTWSSAPDVPATAASGGFWSTLTSSASSSWNSLQSLYHIWSPSAPPQSTLPTPPPTPPTPVMPSPAVTTIAQNSTLRPEAPAFISADSSTNFDSPSISSASNMLPPSISGANSFSPFSTPMADIWKPASTSSASDTTWGQFLPPPMKEEK